MSDINKLVKDIYSVIEGNGGWDATISEHFRKDIGDVVDSRLQTKEEERGTLRLSNLGTPCTRKLWYQVNTPNDGEPLTPDTRFKFLYGDLLESLILSLAKAAGHDVWGEQDELFVAGIKGHRDAVIDGITVDVKSASGFGFNKFAQNNLRSDDPFGYISQLSSYVYAGHQAAPERVHPTIGAFLVVDKQSGKICLDAYDLSDMIKAKEEEAEYLKSMVVNDVPERSFEPVKDGGSGNMKLGTVCNYCQFKKTCWPELRSFAYSNGPRHLVKVARLPNVPEIA